MALGQLPPQAVEVGGVADGARQPALGRPHPRPVRLDDDRERQRRGQRRGWTVQAPAVRNGRAAAACRLDHVPLVGRPRDQVGVGVRDDRPREAIAGARHERGRDVGHRQDDVDLVRLGGGDDGVEEALFVVHRIGILHGDGAVARGVRQRRPAPVADDDPVPAPAERARHRQRGPCPAVRDEDGLGRHRQGRDRRGPGGRRVHDACGRTAPPIGAAPISDSSHAVRRRSASRCHGSRVKMWLASATTLTLTREA